MWRKLGIICLNLVFAAYLVLAFCSWNMPECKKNYCTGVSVIVSDGDENGFVTQQEVGKRLKAAGLYPTGLKMSEISCRTIEELLCQTPFVKSAECYKTQDGLVRIEITQRLPIVHIKALNGEDYYVDEHAKVMPNVQFCSNLIIATGDISKEYASNTIAPLVELLNSKPETRDMFQQIYVTRDHEIELVPIKGNHIVKCGDSVTATKLERLLKFYKYGLNKVGWNKYREINIEFSNQIICK